MTIAIIISIILAIVTYAALTILISAAWIGLSIVVIRNVINMFKIALKSI